MNGWICGVCPECSAVKRLGRSELGQEITCWACDTNFVVLRQRRRSRRSHRLRTSSYLDQFGDATLVTPAAKRQALLTSIAVPLILIAGLQIAAKWSDILTWLKPASTHIHETRTLDPESAR